jgi:hypothetical protein
MTLDLDKLEALAKAATPGPWKHTTYLSGTQNVEFPGSRGVCDVSEVKDANDTEIASSWQSLPPRHVDIAHRAEDKGKDADYLRHANGAFIAAAREAVPALIARVRELEAEVQSLYEDAAGADI